MTNSSSAWPRVELLEPAVASAEAGTLNAGAMAGSGAGGGRRRSAETRMECSTWRCRTWLGGRRQSSARSLPPDPVGGKGIGRLRAMRVLPASSSASYIVAEPKVEAVFADALKGRGRCAWQAWMPSNSSGRTSISSACSGNGRIGVGLNFSEGRGKKIFRS